MSLEIKRCILSFQIYWLFSESCRFVQVSVPFCDSLTLFLNYSGYFNLVLYNERLAFPINFIICAFMHLFQREFFWCLEKFYTKKNKRHKRSSEYETINVLKKDAMKMLFNYHKQKNGSKVVAAASNPSAASVIFLVSFCNLKSEILYPPLDHFKNQHFFKNQPDLISIIDMRSTFFIIDSEKSSCQACRQDLKYDAIIMVFSSMNLIRWGCTSQIVFPFYNKTAFEALKIISLLCTLFT